MSVVGITDITEYIWYCQITDYKTYHKSLSNVKIKIKLLIFGEKTEHIDPGRESVIEYIEYRESVIRK